MALRRTPPLKDSGWRLPPSCKPPCGPLLTGQTPRWHRQPASKVCILWVPGGGQCLGQGPGPGAAGLARGKYSKVQCSPHAVMANDSQCSTGQVRAAGAPCATRRARPASAARQVHPFTPPCDRAGHRQRQRLSGREGGVEGGGACGGDHGWLADAPCRPSPSPREAPPPLPRCVCWWAPTRVLSGNYLLSGGGGGDGGGGGGAAWDFRGGRAAWQVAGDLAGGRGGGAIGRPGGGSASHTGRGLCWFPFMATTPTRMGG